jgi:hypothetical protein
MEKLKKFFSKNGLVSFVVIFLVFFVTTCNKNRKIKRITKENVKISTERDSILNLVPLPEKLILLKLKSEFEIYNKLNNEMSKLDRQKQMMDFQTQYIISPKEKLEIRIKELENK